MNAIAHPTAGITAPNRLLDSTYSTFRQHVDGLLPPLYFHPEFYYFQAPVPDALGLQSFLVVPPMACFINAKCYCQKKDNFSPDALEASGSGTQNTYTKPCLGSFQLSQYRLRVTVKGSSHALHYDSSNTILMQLQGEKQVTLVSPSELSYVYPYPRGHLLFRRAQVCLTRPDYTKFPLSRHLQPVEIVLKAGDILIIPQNTSHTTLALAHSVSLSLRYAHSAIAAPM